MKQILLNRDWRFHLGEAQRADYKGLDDSSWRTVTVPHDWAVEHPFDQSCSSGTGYLPGGAAWYRKHFTLPQDIEGKCVRIRFDGVYQNSRVWCNSNYLGMRPYGYSSFSYDISEFVVPGENVISVRVEHIALADSRWYTGNGIYRDVTLLIGEPVHFEEHGVFVYTKSADAQSAKLGIRWKLEGGAADVRFSVIDAQGIQVANGTASGEGGEVELTVEKPALWSPASPSMYSLRCEARGDDALLDEVNIPFGIRTFRFDAGEGFFLNGESMKLKGVCVHHDAGTLGAAVPTNVWARRLKKLQLAGCNAVRMSHNPPDPKLLDLCDKMGFLVIDEAFDEWEGCKNKWWQGHNVYPPKLFGYSDAFPMWHEADLSELVRRDRNHPCVILWSIGNEVDYPNDPYVHPLFESMTGNNDASKPAQERQYDPNKPNAKRLATIAKKLSKIVKLHDDTRPVTAALAFPELSNETGYAQALDVVGYNYKEHLYTENHERFPGHILVGSENGKGPREWLAVKNNPYISSQFLWTGIDFMGEAKGWPVRVSQAGIMTMAGFEKASYWHRMAMWTDAPCAHLCTSAGDVPFGELRTWDYEEGEIVTVSCYTNCADAELLLNGQTLGKVSLTEADGYCARWTVPYAQGELRVICGEISDALCTQSGDIGIQLSVYKEALCTSERVVQVEVQLVDAAGRPVAAEERTLNYMVEGDAEIIGIENGNAQDLTPYPSRARDTYRGQAVVYIRVSEQAKTAKLRVSAKEGICADVNII